MSQLYGPDGKPIQPQLSQAQLIQIIQIFDHQLKALGTHLNELSFFTEYMHNTLTTTMGPDGKPLLAWDAEAFGKYVQERVAQLQTEAQARFQQAAQEANTQHPDIKLDLDADGARRP